MNKYIILVDATSDLTKELREKYDIEYIKGHVTFPDGVEHIATLDWNEIDKEVFFKDLRNKANNFSTAPASVEEYKVLLREYLSKGLDVMIISISSKLSGTYNFTLQVKEELSKEFPERKIVCIDSRRYSTAYGMLAIQASMLRSEGKSIEEVETYLNENRNRIHQIGPLDDLSFLAKRGRISHAKAFMGSLIGVKPLGDFSKDGLPTILAKAKGEKKAFDACVEYCKQIAGNIEDQVVFLAHTNRPKQIEYFKQLVEKELKPKEIIVSDVFVMNSINTGPGLTAIYFLGKPISDDLEYEKGLMDSILKK